MEKTWDIIVWTLENSIDYVPSCWGNSTRTKYKYPASTNNPSKIKKEIDTCTALTEHFEWLEATCKAASVKDLSMAKHMCEKGQYTSNLESDDSKEPGKRRSRKKKKLLYETDKSSSDTSDESQMKKLTIKPSNIVASNRGLVRENFEFLQESPSVTNGSTTSVQTTGSTASAAQRTEPVCHTTSLKASNDLRTPVRTTPSCSSNNKTSTLSKDDVSKLLVEIYELKFEQQETRKILERVERLVANNAIANIPNENVNKYMEKIPCRTKPDLDNLDAEIRNKDNFKDLVNLLYLLGGSSPHKSVYLMMNKLLDKTLALEYSGQGKKKKTPFCNLKLFDAIIAAVRKRHSSASEDSIKKSVALFLASAKSRLPKNENQREIEDEAEFA